MNTTGPDRSNRIMRIIAGTLLACSASIGYGHSLMAPVKVEAEQDGSFHFEALFRIGPGGESLSFYEVHGSSDLNLAGYVADGECLFVLPEGDEIDIVIEGSLIDPGRAGVAFVQLVTCGISGTQTVFEAQIAVVPWKQHTLYWTEAYGAVWRATIDGSLRRRLVGLGETTPLHSIDVDPLGGMIYWEAFPNPFPPPLVERMNWYGGPVETLQFSLQNLAIDWPSRMLYYTEPADCSPGCGWMARVGLDMENFDLLMHDMSLPNAIDADSATGTLCWSEIEFDLLRCSTLDAQEARTIATDTVSLGVHIDPVLGQVYWLDASPQRIRRASLDGAHVEDLVTSGIGSAQDLALDPIGRKVYWSDVELGEIRRANLDGSDVETVLGDVDPWGLAVDAGQGAIEVAMDAEGLHWSLVPGVTAFDVVRGDLELLRSSGGDYAAALLDCVADSISATELLGLEDPAPGAGFWFLVRGVTSTGNGTYDSGGFHQIQSRDLGVTQSPADCD